MDRQPCVVTSIFFKMNSTCMPFCDLNLSSLSTSITRSDVFSCQNEQRIQISICMADCVYVLSLPILSFCEIYKLLTFTSSNQLESVIFLSAFQINIRNAKI